MANQEQLKRDMERITKSLQATQGRYMTEEELAAWADAQEKALQARVAAQEKAFQERIAAHERKR